MDKNFIESRVHNIKDIQIVDKNIRTLKRQIIIERVNYLLALTTAVAFNEAPKYTEVLASPSAQANAIVLTLCAGIFALNTEKIKTNKFRIGELEFEKEKLEGKSR